MTERRQKPQQNYKLGAAVRHSGLYPSHLGAKMILAELCNFSVIGTGRGWCYNAPLGNVAGVKVKQVGRIKRKLEDDGFATFTHVKGKGRHTDFQLHTEAIQTAMDMAPGINEAPFTGDPYTPLGGGVKTPMMGVKPPLADPLTPPSGSQNPPSRGDPIGNKNIKTGARGAGMGLSAPDGAATASPSRDELSRKALSLTSRMDSRYGRNARRSALEGGAFTMDGEAIVATVVGPSNEAFIREAVKTLSKGTEGGVRIVVLNERAVAQ